MTPTSESNDALHQLTDEETFIWQATLAVAQGRATLGNEEHKEFAGNCVAKAVALWDEFVLAVEGGPF